MLILLGPGVPLLQPTSLSGSQWPPSDMIQRGCEQLESVWTFIVSSSQLWWTRYGDWDSGYQVLLDGP